jgi:DNA-binding phage protein
LLTLGLYPVIGAVPQKTNHKIPSHLWPEVVQRRQTESLRAIAQDYGVSHEAVRRTLKTSCAPKLTTA